jgi:hypothetical protein
MVKSYLALLSLDIIIRHAKWNVMFYVYFLCVCSRRIFVLKVMIPMKVFVQLFKGSGQREVRCV